MITDPVKITDTELLRRYAVGGDEAAFTELVQRNLPVVYNAALRRLDGNTHLAEEAAQIVFTQLACKARSLVRHPAFLGWLFTSTRFAASAIHRREVRRLNHEHAAAAMPPDNTSNPDWTALRPLLDDALEELNEADRHAIVLRFFSGRSHAEIGAELRISTEAARKRVDRAIERLRDALAHRGVTTTAAALAMTMAAAPMVAAPAALAGHIAATALTAASAAVAGATLSTAVMAAQVTPTLLATISVVTALVLGTGIATWSHQEQRARELDALHVEAVATRARLANLRRQPAPTPRAQAVAENAASRAPADPLQAKMIENLRAWEKIANDPVYAKVREQEFRMRAQREFGVFLAARSYPPQKAEFLRRALAAYYDAAERVQMDFQLAGINAVVDGKELGPRLAHERDALFAGLAPEFAAQELGDIRRCFDAQREMPDVRSASRQLAFDGTPLTREQELSLAMVLADVEAARVSASSEARQKLVKPDETGLSPRDRARLDDAAVFWSPAQLRGYENYLRQENVRSAIEARVREQVAAGAVAP